MFDLGYLDVFKDKVGRGRYVDVIIVQSACIVRVWMAWLEGLLAREDPMSDAGFSRIYAASTGRPVVQLAPLVKPELVMQTLRHHCWADCSNSLQLVVFTSPNMSFGASGGEMKTRKLRRGVFGARSERAQLSRPQPTNQQIARLDLSASKVSIFSHRAQKGP